MDQVCLLLPVASDKTEAAREFMRDLEEVRKADYVASEERIGISKEVWFLAPLPDGAALVAYIESDDFNRSLGEFVTSRDDFDLWFKMRLAESTGLDLNYAPSGPMPEMLSSYSA